MKKRHDTSATTNPARIPAPKLPYRPQDPKRYNPGIALVGCGGISRTHLRAYRAAGYRVLALADVDLTRARKRRDEFFPEAKVYRQWKDVLRDDRIEVVDLATHPRQREGMIAAALRTRRHVLSQKPFVLDLDRGQRLVDLADRMQVLLAVNQNGRWAPHFSYIRQAVRAGLLGRVFAARFSVHWDHSWLVDSPFNRVKHLILYDFGIHWFDMVHCLLADRPARRVYASVARSPEQRMRPPLLAQAVVEFDDAQASLVFDGDVHHGPHDRTFVAGKLGTLLSEGPNIREQKVTLSTGAGIARPRLRGCWFPDGFHGAMAELLCAVEQKRQPENSAADNLHSLALCFAAVASSMDHEPMVPGAVRRLPR